MTSAKIEKLMFSTLHFVNDNRLTRSFKGATAQDFPLHKSSTSSPYSTAILPCMPKGLVLKQKKWMLSFNFAINCSLKNVADVTKTKKNLFGFLLSFCVH